MEKGEKGNFDQFLQSQMELPQRSNIESRNDPIEMNNSNVVISTGGRDLPEPTWIQVKGYSRLSALLSSWRFLQLWITIILIIATTTLSFAQTKAQVKNVNFELVNNEVIITYDIVKHRPDEMFKIWVKIYTAQENELKAESLTGAVGENVSGGDHKKIVWNPAKDGVYLDNDIYIQVFAGSTSRNTDDGVSSDVSMGKWLMLSALYPGTGNAKVRSNKLWLAAGALGYGSMVGSVLLNSKASKSYDNYLRSQDVSERNDLFNDADSQKQLSTILFVSGAVIWAADLLLFTLNSKKPGTSANSNKDKTVYLGYSNETIDGYGTQRLLLKISL